MRRSVLIALSTSAALACMLVGAAERTIQKWVDENGVVHFGHAPPPDAVKTDRTVLNAQGVPVGQIPRQRTPEEAAAEQKRREEEERRRAEDTFLLTTYTRVADIERLRDDQLSLIDAQIELARSSLAAIDEQIQALARRMSNFRPYSSSPNARRLPDALAGEVVQALGQRRSLKETLARHEQRREETRAKYQGYITRYLELTSRPTIR